MKPWKFCPQCAEKLDLAWKFCANCGEGLNPVAGFVTITYPSSLPTWSRAYAGMPPEMSPVGGKTCVFDPNTQSNHTRTPLDNLQW